MKSPLEQKFFSNLLELSSFSDNGNLTTTEIPELGCGCNEFGSENSTSCDDWGQCTCKCNVEGEKCDHCSAGYFGLSSVSPTECHGTLLV